LIVCLIDNFYASSIGIRDISSSKCTLNEL